MYLRSLLGLLGRFKDDRRGNIALITGLLLVPMVGAVGCGIDYTRAVTYRIKLDSAATAASLAGIEMSRSYLLANPGATSKEVSAAGQKRALEVFNARAPAADATFFVKNVRVGQVGETLSADIQYTGSVKTIVANIFAINSIGVSGSAYSSAPLTLGSEPVDPENPNVIIKENFQDAQILESGGFGFRTNWNGFLTNNAGGVEIGKYNVYGVEKPPNGDTLVAELDSFVNNAMSKKIFLTAGSYELRYLYRDRVVYPTYNPAWICGSVSDDVDWAQDPSNTFGSQTNRIGVYLEVAPTDVPPKVYDPKLHNLVDVCVSSGAKWLQRSVKIKISAPGFFWLAFQAEGANDSYGGFLTGISLCKDTCPEAILDDFPWEANKVLFSDNFETPANLAPSLWTERTLDSSGTNTGWPLLPSGWTTHPFNQVDFQKWGYLSGPEGGLLAVELDSSSYDGSESNRSISRRVILPPGYYQLKYNYNSMPWWGLYDFRSCGLTSIATQIGNTTLLTGSSGYPVDTAKVGVYVDADRNVSHPESEAVLRAPSVWKDTDGMPATKPGLPITPVDACMYSKLGTTRTVYFKITKPGFYWITFRGEGTNDNHGGSINLVSLTALSSIRKGTQPSDAVSIPAPGLPAGSPIILNNMQVLAQ